MKLEKFFLATFCLIATLFTSCSNDEVANSNKELKGSAYLSLNLVPNKANGQTRASSIEYGTPTESKVNSAIAYLFDADKLLIKVIKYPTDAPLSVSETASISHTNNAVLVPANAKYAFIVTGSFQPAYTVGITTFATLNAAIKATVDLAENDNFMMTNDGSADVGMTDRVEGLAIISSNLKTTSTAADAAPAQIKVNRVVAKVEVKVNDPLSVIPEGAKAELKNWCLDRTSLRFFPYSVIDENITSSTYRKSPTYQMLFNTTTAADSPNNINTEFTINTNYNKTFGTAAYCLENTMDASFQKGIRTTAILVKAFYRPAKTVFFEGKDDSYSDNNSYFVYDGNVYSLTQMKANAAAATKFQTLATEVGISSAATSTEADWNAKNAELTRNTMTGIQFYQQGLNYYRVLIRHDDSVTGAMALGRYGVVRNNWYVLTIKSIEGPASPWTPIPGDDDDDDSDIWLSVDVIVNPWIQWKQNVDL